MFHESDEATTLLDSHDGPVEFEPIENPLITAAVDFPADEIIGEDVLLVLADEEDDLGDGPPAGSQGSIGGTLASVVLHVWLIATLAGMTVNRERTLPADPIDTRIAEDEEPEELEQTISELFNPNDREFEVREVVNAASVGQSLTLKPKPQSAPQPLKEILPTDFREELYDISEGLEIDERLVVKGTTGDAVVQLESALDRVTWEIAQNLKQRKVLVVWMLDASASLMKQRATIVKRFNRIYGELDALEKTDQIPRMKRPLLSAVVSYGATTNFITREPTDDFKQILDAVKNAPTDDSGVENVFNAVSQTMDLWKKYRVNNGRQIMLIVVTDESGDDFGSHLELAIAKCRRYGAKAYVVGPPAVFGRRKGYVDYVAPENGRTYQLPIDLGPETPLIERVDLPFWFDGPQYTYLSSGYGPYALSRLVKESGGIYFMTNMTTSNSLSPLGAFGSEALRPFEPDYGYSSRQQYLTDINRFPLRKAVYTASVLSRKNKAEGTPAMELRVTPQNFRQVAATAQETVARSQLMIDTILQAFPPRLEQAYENEPSLRWRMSYSLAYGRLLAQRVRCLEYNYACAHLKNDLSSQDVGRKSNHWIFRPAAEINYAIQLKRVADDAKRLLERVVDEAPGTPWAVLAARELRNPLGIRVIERFIPPPTPRQQRRAAAGDPKPRLLLAAERRKQAAKKAAPKPKPPKLPKL